MSSDSSDGGLITLAFFFLMFMFTCGTCQNTNKTKDKVEDLNQHMTVIESKLDTLIKYQKAQLK